MRTKPEKRADAIQILEYKLTDVIEAYALLPVGDGLTTDQRRAEIAYLYKTIKNDLLTCPSHPFAERMFDPTNASYNVPAMRNVRAYYYARQRLERLIDGEDPDIILIEILAAD